MIEDNFYANVVIKCEGFHVAFLNENFHMYIRTNTNRLRIDIIR